MGSLQWHTMKDESRRREELRAAALTGHLSDAQKQEFIQVAVTDPSIAAELEEVQSTMTRLDAADIKRSEEPVPSNLEARIIDARTKDDPSAPERSGAGSASRARLAGTEDLEAAAHTLTAAFKDYPWTRHVIPTQEYELRLHRLQHLYLTHAEQHGIVVVTGAIEGVLALLPPDPPTPAPEVLEQILALHGDRIDRLTQTEGSPGAWRLETLGVRPESQGQGLATALLFFGLSAAATHGAQRVELETSDPRNVRLYERHGFTVTSSTEPLSAPPVWHMENRLPSSA